MKGSTNSFTTHSPLTSALLSNDGAPTKTGFSVAGTGRDGPVPKMSTRMLLTNPLAAVLAPWPDNPVSCSSGPVFS